MDRPPLTLVQVPPIGTQETTAFVCTSDRGCGLRPVACNVYPEPEFDLQEYRRRRGLGLRDCAKLLGLRASEVSGLERGSLLPAGGWAAVVDVLAVHALAGEWRSEEIEARAWGYYDAADAFRQLADYLEGGVHHYPSHPVVVAASREDRNG